MQTDASYLRITLSKLIKSELHLCSLSLLKAEQLYIYIHYSSLYKYVAIKQDHTGNLKFV